MNRRLVLAAMATLSCVDEAKVREVESRLGSCKAQVAGLETAASVNKKKAEFWRVLVRLVHFSHSTERDFERTWKSIERDLKTLKDQEAMKVLEPDDEKLVVTTLNWANKAMRKNETTQPSEPPDKPIATPKSADEAYGAVKSAADEKKWDQVEPLVQQLKAHYPSHKLVKKAETILKQAATELQKVAEERERQKKEREIEESLTRVTVQEIYANIGDYKGKPIVRKLECYEPSEVSTPAFRFKMSCTIQHKYGEARQGIDVGLDAAHVRLLAKLPREINSFVVKLRMRILGREKYGSDIVAKLVEIVVD